MCPKRNGGGRELYGMLALRSAKRPSSRPCGFVDQRRCSSQNSVVGDVSFAGVSFFKETETVFAWRRVILLGFAISMSFLVA